MCGLLGLLNWGDEEKLTQLTNLQFHRGPDDGGTWFSRSDDNWIGLGSRRLAIRDLSPSGHMPMVSSCGRYTMAYNGEIYNEEPLRADLLSKGYHFRSTGDTEVILNLYAEYGSDAIRKLNGMFALAIWDKEREHLFIARDHFGIKPLYYVHHGKKFACASEMKALTKLPDFQTCMDFHALHQYLTFLWVPDPLTIVQGVYKLPAGCYAIIQNGQIDIVRYWDLTYPSHGHTYRPNSAELQLEIRERFSQVVKSQMISDVPLGAFLSAGLDSSSIVACMAQHSTQPIQTFTISFPEKYRNSAIMLDDTAVAARTAAHFGCQHHEINVMPDVVDLLPKLVWHMDEPTADPAIIMAYLVNRAAREHVTVLLSGVGGDEIFAGYRKYQAHYLAQTYQRLPTPLRRHLIEPAIASLPAMSNSPFKGYVRLAKKMARSGSLAPRDRFIMDSVYMSDKQQQQLLSASMWRQVMQRDAREQHLGYFDNVAHADFLNQMLYVDTKAFMISLNLNYNDKMSMASSVETRVPFLDWEFAEWVAWNVDPRKKLHQSTPKHILRESMRPLLPTEVLEQKKAGFAAPIAQWLSNDLDEMMSDLLSESRLRQRGIFDGEHVQTLIREQKSGYRDHSFQIWQLITLELWMDAFMTN